MSFVGKRQEKKSLEKTKEEQLPESSMSDNQTTSKEEMLFADSQIENCHQAIRLFIEEDAPMTKLSSASEESSYYASIQEPLLFEVFRNKQTFTFYIRCMKKEESQVLYCFSYDYANDRSQHISGHHAFEEHFTKIRSNIVHQFGTLPEFAVIAKNMVLFSPPNWSGTAESITRMYKHNIFWEENQSVFLNNRLDKKATFYEPSNESFKEIISPTIEEPSEENTELRSLSDEIETVANDILSHPYYTELSTEESHQLDTIHTDCKKVQSIYASLENKESELVVESIIDGLETALTRLKQIRQTLSNKSHAQVKRQLSLMSQRYGAD